MQTQRSRLDRLAADSATAFLLAVLCVYPLYIDKFSNLGVTKFTGVFTLFLGFCLWLAACWAIGAHGIPGRWQKRDGRTLSLAAVALATALSTVCSLSPTASVWGLGSYYGGLMMVLFTSLGYLCVRAFAAVADFDGIALAVGGTSTIVTVLYVLNTFNIDLIGTYANTAVVERAQFFSTLGQKNFNSGYLAVTLPIVFWMFLSTQGSRRTVAYGIPAFMGGLALAVVDADGLLLGLAAAMVVLVCAKDFTTRTLRRMMFLGMAFFFWAGFMQYWREHVYTQGGAPMLAALGKIAIGGFCVCAAVWLALLALEKRFHRVLPLCRPARVLAVLAVAALLLLLVWANFLPGYPGLGALDGFLVFNDEWGTFRGTGWRAAWGVWADGSLFRKLVGVGPGMMHRAVVRWAGESLTPRMNTFYAAHNEYLEQLLTTGVAGLAAWLWFLVSHLKAVRGHWDRPGVAPVTLALASYLTQAAVSIRVSMVFPEVMLLFALLAAFTAPRPAEPAPAKAKKPKAAARPSRPWRRWLALVAAAIMTMALSGALSKIFFGFLFG